MHKILLRTILAVIIISLTMWAYFNNYFSPYYAKYPKATTYKVPTNQIYYFPNLSGPKTHSVISKPVATSYKKYAEGSHSRLAVLLTNTKSDWLSLAHGLKSIGIPFLITTSYRVALSHRVVLIYPSTHNLGQEALTALAKFPQQGGTLIAQMVLSPYLFETFGFRETKPIQEKVHRLQWNSKLLPIKETDTSHLNENLISDKFKVSTAGYSYLDPTELPLATYENDAPAITQKNYPQGGHAYAFGIDLGHLLRIGYNNNQSQSYIIQASKNYLNRYIPYLDMLLQCIKNLYLEGQSNGVTLDVVPEGKSLAVIITHDIDYLGSIPNSLSYMEMERKYGVKATYFIQTKYIRDSNDVAFFTQANLPLFKKLVDNNMEVSSHSVSHSLQFSLFPLGTGKEQYPNYQPYVMETGKTYTRTILKAIPDTVTYNGSILGELRVSRFLLNHFFPNLSLLSFRPGFLQNPYQLPQALVATGFHYSSSTTASDSLTHLPFQLMFNRGRNMPFDVEVPVYEFPITLEDQESPSLIERLPQALSLAKKISQFGGLYVILIHPDTIGSSFKFLDRFIPEVQKLIPTWFGTLAEFGNWWAARDQVAVDVIQHEENQTVQLIAPLAISGLTLLLPDNFHYVSSSKPLKVKQVGNKFIIIDRIQGKVSLNFNTKASF